MIFSLDAANPLKGTDSFCLFERKRPFACGTVVKKLKTGDEVLIAWSTRHLAVGDRYKIARQNRVPASLPNAIVLAGNSTVEVPSEKRSGLGVFIAAGGLGNTEHFAPNIHLQLRISEPFRMGLLFSYSGSTDAGNSASLLGGLATFQFVPFSKVSSFSLFVLGGIYNLSSTVGGGTESAKLISLGLTLEWRQFIGGGLFLSVAGGVQYTTRPLLQLADVNVSGTKPLVLVQLGLSL